MSLRKELERLIRFELAEDTAYQRLAFDPNRGDDVAKPISPDEHLMITFKLISALREAVFRLADEIDAIKLDA